MKKITKNSFYLVGILGANALNLLFNVLVGRELNFTDFGLVTFVSTLGYLGGIFLTSLSVTITHRVSFLIGRGKKTESANFYSKTRANVLKITAVYILLWMVLLVPLTHFFVVNSYLPLLCFLPVLPLGVFTSMNRGYLNGNLQLFDVGMLTLLEAVVKFLLALVFIALNSTSLVYIAIPISGLFAALLSSSMVWKKLPSTPDHSSKTYFPKKFYIASLATGFSTSAFLTIDILVAKHFLSADSAGQYAFLALMGKIIYFCGSLLITLIISYVSRNEGKGGKNNDTFKKLFVCSLGLTLFPYIFIGWLGKWTLPVIFGNKVYIIVPYLPLYALAISLFTISIQIVSYYLAKKQFQYTWLTTTNYIVIVCGIVIFHRTISDIVMVMVLGSVFNLLSILVMRFFLLQKIFLAKVTR